VAEAGAQDSATPRQWLGLLVLGLGLAIVIIDGTIVNVALPAISRDFGAGLRELQWVNSIYSLVYAALIVTFGRIGDQFGRRLMFVLGVGVFLAGSALSGAASSVGMLIGARALQGLGAAMTSPSTLSIISGTFTGRMRGVAFGVWGAIAGAAAALGPLLGGWLTTAATWRWAFYINVPIGIVAVVGALLLVDESKAGGKRAGTDVLGIVLISLGVGALVLGLIEGQTYGWLFPRNGFAVAGWTWPAAGISVSLAAFIVTALALVGFVLWEMRMQGKGREPLFDLSLLGFRSFRFGLITVSIVALGEFGVIFVLSLFLQGVLGFTALATGLTFLPFAVLTLFVAPSAGLLTARFGPKWVVTAGMVIEAVFIFVLSRVLGPATTQTTLILVLLGYGVGVGLAIAQLTNVVLSEVPPQRLGAASGANNTLRQVGSALGIAVIGAVLAATLSTSAKTRLAAETEVPDFVKTLIAKSLDEGVGVGEGSFRLSGAPAGMEESPAFKRIGVIIKDSFTDATRASGLAASLFVLLGAASSLFIPNTVRRGAPARSTRAGRGARGGYRRIVVPLDGSPAAETVLPRVAELAGRGAQIVLVRVTSEPGFDYLLRDAELSACLDEELTGEAGRYLARVARSLAASGAEVSTCVLAEKGPVSDIIQGFAREVKADLIAMSAHGKPGGVGRLLGAPAERISHRSGIPVLLVHPG
jgi:EmrB/QacA subfamily drug resistance transporter